MGATSATSATSDESRGAALGADTRMPGEDLQDAQEDAQGDAQGEAPVEELSFKEASAELEQVVRALEGGDLELEDALSRYARGVELLASLRKRLAEAEQKVQVLLDASGVATEAPDTVAAPSTAFLDE